MVALNKGSLDEIEPRDAFGLNLLILNELVSRECLGFSTSNFGVDAYACFVRMDDERDVRAGLPVAGLDQTQRKPNFECFRARHQQRNRLLRLFLICMERFVTSIKGCS